MKNPKNNPSRREFFRQSLQWSGALAGATAFSSCSVLDSYFESDKKSYDNEVLIIGGGSAGLAAAHSLKKKRIPYRLFEASSRIGGRVQSLSSLEENSGPLEMGAESFDLKHRCIFDLAKEFKLEVEPIESRDTQNKFFYYRNRWTHQRELAQLLQPYIRNWSLLQLKLFSENEQGSSVIVHPLALSFDQWGLRDYFRSLKPVLDRELENLLIRWIQTEIPLQEQDISALMWIVFWEAQASQNSYYRIEGGNEALIRALYDRVAGAIPDHLVQLNTPLLSLREQEGRFECIFQGPQGYRRVKTRHIVLAVPLSQLRKIQGVSELVAHPLKKEALSELQMSQQVKAIYEMKDFNQKNSEGPPWPFQCYSREHYSRLWSDNDRLHALWSVPTPGARAVISPEEISRSVMSLNKKTRSQWTGKATVLDWSQKPWIQGAVLSYKKNQFYKYRGLFVEPEFNGRLVFAGDYVHPTDWSSWSGALESGLWAADKIFGTYQGASSFV